MSAFLRSHVPDGGRIENKKPAAFAAGFFFRGEGGIRTRGTVSRTPDLQSGALDHSTTYILKDYPFLEITGFKKLFKKPFVVKLCMPNKLAISLVLPN